MRLRPGAASAFEPGLTIPYPALSRAGVRIRRGQTSLTVGAPGAGKSQLWHNLAQRMQVPTLYWSADTDQADVTTRTLAMWLGLTTAEVEEWMADAETRDWMFARLAGRADHIEWVFDSSITGRAAGERLNAFAEVHGQYPSLMVLDNLSNAVGNPADEYAEIKQVMGAAQKLARQTRAHIAILHHAKGAYEDGTKAIPQGGASQNPFKTVELGFTVWRPDPEHLAVSAVKNRGGESDPGANSPINFSIDFSRATVSGFATHTTQE